MKVAALPSEIQTSSLGHLQMDPSVFSAQDAIPSCLGCGSQPMLLSRAAGLDENHLHFERHAADFANFADPLRMHHPTRLVHLLVDERLAYNRTGDANSRMHQRAFPKHCPMTSWMLLRVAVGEKMSIRLGSEHSRRPLWALQMTLPTSGRRSKYGLVCRHLRAGPAKGHEQ